MTDDGLFPQGGKHNIRNLLKKLGENQDRLTNHPIYKEGFNDGFKQGKQEAERLSQHVISGLVRIYDQSD